MSDNEKVPAIGSIIHSTASQELEQATAEEIKKEDPKGAEAEDVIRANTIKG